MNFALAQKTISEVKFNSESHRAVAPAMESKPNSTLAEFIKTNKRYPLKPLLYGKKSGKVTISYVISSSGKIKNQRVLSSTDKSYSKEVFRLLNTSGSWKPGQWDGKIVNVKCTITVDFDAPLETDFNLRNATVINNGVILPKNKIWYLADHIYLDQVVILNNKESEALLGSKTELPTIVINSKDDYTSTPKTLYSKLKNVDSNYYSLYIDDKKVSLDYWKKFLDSGDIKNFEINKDTLFDSKWKAKIRTITLINSK